MPNVSLLTSGIGDVNQGGSLVPTGTVFAFAGSTAPSGWLVCDGTAHSQTTYFALFSALGTTYNNQINPTTNAAYPNPAAGTFRVPDYRGIFLRSSGQALNQTAVSVGGHQGHLTSRPANSFTGSVSGSAASAGNHTHILTSYGNGGGASGWGPATGDSSSPLSDRPPTSNGVQTTGAHTHTVSGSCNIEGGGDSETRPINKGVLYIIKV
jgi:microcystin-dependent protein